MTTANGNLSTHTNRPVWHRFQFSLRSALLFLTACAVIVWITVELGFIPVLGSLGAFFVGGIAGAAVGLPFRTSQRSSVVGAISAVTAIGIVVVWLLCIIAVDLRSRGQPFPVVIPLKFLLRDWLHVTGLAIALTASIPAASIAAVNERRDAMTVLWPATTCAGVAFLSGIVFFAYDVWCRGGFPEPPLPWPIALAIPLFAATIAAACLGLVTGLVWLAIRPVFLRNTQKGVRPE